MAVKRVDHILQHSRYGRYRAVHAKVLKGLTELIEVQTGLKVGVMPWQGDTAVLLVDHPADRFVLQQKEDRVLKVFEQLVPDLGIRKIRVQVARGSGTLQ